MENAQEYLDTIRGDGFLSPMLSSYLAARPWVAGREVLDFGCGYGWGSYLLSECCARVTGCDTDRGRIRFARETFCRDNLAFLEGGGALAPGGYDAICLFQVVAHLENPAEVLESLACCLRPKGRLLFSCKESAADALRLVEGFAAKNRLVPLYQNERRLSEADRVIERGYQLPPKGAFPG